MQNGILTVCSLLFYAWGEPVYIFLLIGLVLLDGFLAQCIGSALTKRRKDVLTILAVTMNIGLLFIYKYAGFLVETVNVLLPIRVHVPQLRLPLGISFFTFQALSYVLDVRRGKSTPLHDYGLLLLYLSFFPQLVAGPIIQWHTLKEQFYVRRMTWSGTANGLRRFIVGLSKKVLLADVIGKIVDASFACPIQSLSAPLAWMGAIAYTLQIYLDFSGYSDMAIGMGHMLGFDFPENFRHPLRADSMRAFWRCWHITLTDWFREYLYIPLGGNRRGKWITYRNLAIVFACTGLWHGANWTFLIWGVWNGLFVIFERAQVLKTAKWPRPLARLYTLAIVILGFVIFRAGSLGEAMHYLGVMATGYRLDQVALSYLLEQCTPANLTMLVVATMVSLNALSSLQSRIQASGWWPYFYAPVCVVLLVYAYASLLASGYHPFIYFRF